MSHSPKRASLRPSTPAEPERRRDGRPIPTGWPELDAVLPAGGLDVGDIATIRGTGGALALVAAWIRGCRGAVGKSRHLGRARFVVPSRSAPRYASGLGRRPADTSRRLAGAGHPAPIRGVRARGGARPGPAATGDEDPHRALGAPPSHPPRRDRSSGPSLRALARARFSMRGLDREPARGRPEPSSPADCVRHASRRVFDGRRGPS